MTIIEGQIQPLKELRETLSRNGITRFNSVGDINRFLKDFAAEKDSLHKFLEQELEKETKNLQSQLQNQQESYVKLKSSTQNEINQEN